MVFNLRTIPRISSHNFGLGIRVFKPELPRGVTRTPLGQRRHSSSSIFKLFSSSSSQAHLIARLRPNSSSLTPLKLALLTRSSVTHKVPSSLSRLVFGIRTMASGNFPSTIKAIGCPQQGDVDVISLLDLPFPEQKPDEVLIKVLYAGVNFIDTYIRKGLYPAKSFPVRLGTECSGVVVGLPTDPEVLNDPKYQRLGIHLGGKVAASAPGGMAQYVSVPWKNLMVLPDSVSPLDACVLFIQGLTALAFMTEAHNVKSGQTILIHTVAGGFGLLAAQIAKSRGATVIGTTSTEAKAELAKSHGADYVILYTKEDTVKRVEEITGGQGVDAIYDGVGKDTIDADFEMIKRKGTLVSVGNASGPVPPFPPLRLTPKNLTLLRPTVMNYLVTPDESYYYFTEMIKLIQSGTIKVNLHKIYPFTAEGVQQSQIDITGRDTTGKLIIQVSEE